MATFASLLWERYFTSSVQFYQCKRYCCPFGSLFWGRIILQSCPDLQCLGYFSILTLSNNLELWTAYNLPTWEKWLPLHRLCQNRYSVGRRVDPVVMKMGFMVCKRFGFFFHLPSKTCLLFFGFVVCLFPAPIKEYRHKMTT